MQRIEALFDGRTIRSKDDFYAAVEAIPETPDWFGRNLDALFDLVLAAIQAPLTIHWTHAEVSAKNMGPDFDILVGVLKDAEAEPRSLFKLYLTEGPAKAETIGKDV